MSWIQKSIWVPSSWTGNSKCLTFHDSTHLWSPFWSGVRLLDGRWLYTASSGIRNDHQDNANPFKVDMDVELSHSYISFFCFNNSDWGKIVWDCDKTNKMKTFKNISIHADQMISKKLRRSRSFSYNKFGVWTIPYGEPPFEDHFLVTSITDEKESFGITGENSIRRTNSSWGSKLRTSWPFSAFESPCWAGKDKWFRGLKFDVIRVPQTRTDRNRKILGPSLVWTRAQPSM